MLDAIKEVLTTFSPNYNLDVKCSDVTRIENRIDIKLDITDYQQNGQTFHFEESVTVPDLTVDGMTYITIAQARRVVKVFNRTLVIGSTFRNAYSLEFDYYTDGFLIRKGTDQIYPPMEDVITRNGETKSIPKFDPLSIFSYYPGLTSNFYNNDFPQLTPESQQVLDSVIAEVTLDEDIMKSLSVFARKKLASNKLTAENLQILLDICDNKEDFIDVTLPMDYEVGTAENLIRNDIKNSKYRIQKRLFSSFSRQPRGARISLYELQNAINKITRVTEDGINPLQEDTDTNALATLSQGSKAYFKAKDVDTGKYESTRLRPKYFVGIVDPSFTADSNLVNKKNQLARSAIVVDGVFKVKVMTKDFKPRILDSYTYLSSAILSQDNVDYVNKKLVPDRNGEYNIYQWGEYSYVDSVDKIDYIRYQDSVISESTALLPFANKTSPMRVMLGTHMIAEQSMPVVGAKPSIIYTGVGKDVFDESKQVLRATKEGMVKGVGEKFINIDNMPTRYQDSFVTSNHSTVTFSPTVKAGDKVKQGQVIAISNSFVDDEFTTAVPLFTAYTTYHGFDHEDAVVMSESAAKKFGHPDTYELRIPLKYTALEFNNVSTPQNNLDKYGLIKTGAYVKEGDPLFVYTQVSSDIGGVDIKRANTVKVPNHINGRVKSVTFKYFRSKRAHGTDNDKYLNPKYKGLVELKSHFNRRIAEDIKAEMDRTGLSVVDIKPQYEIEAEEPSLANDIFCEITITINYINIVKMADKITNYYGGKGTVSEIVPDDQFLRTQDGKVIDIIVSPLAIMARTNISQMYESLLSYICVKFYEELDKFYHGKSDLTEEELQYILDQLRWETVGKNELKKVYNESKKYGYVRVRVSSSDKHFTEELLLDLKKRLKFENQVILYDPKYGRNIRTPITVGYQNFVRLHFMPEKKATTRGGNNGLMLKDRTPVIFGYGRTKSEGQKIGEQELWALQSHGMTELSQEYVNKANKQNKLISDFLSLELALEEN